MAKRKHSKMIKAWADNDELVACSRKNGGPWHNCGVRPSWFEDRDYFLCLPKHNKNGQCLHWLNGGKIQWSDDIHGWSDKDNYVDDLKSQEFFSGNAFMLDDNKFRIKPKKETRYVVIHKGKLVSELFKSDANIMASQGAECYELQIFPIEIEV
jgi:hypothetical protein